jgi:hypothetical protein
MLFFLALLTFASTASSAPCTCAAAWSSLYEADPACALTQNGCTNCDNDPIGPWCIVESAPCDGGLGEVTGEAWFYCDNPSCSKRELEGGDAWNGCDWKDSNSNAAGEEFVGYVETPDECIEMVKSYNEDYGAGFDIANVGFVENSYQAECWGQYGGEPVCDGSGWASCVLPTSAVGATSTSMKIEYYANSGCSDTALLVLPQEIGCTAGAGGSMSTECECDGKIKEYFYPGSTDCSGASSPKGFHDRESDTCYDIDSVAAGMPVKSIKLICPDDPSCSSSSGSSDTLVTIAIVIPIVILICGLAITAAICFFCTSCPVYKSRMAKKNAAAAAAPASATSATEGVEVEVKA